MFDIFCTACERRHLVSAGQVRGIVNDERGIHVVFDCRCGATAVWTTGRAAEQAVAA